MSNRLDKDREATVQPQRIAECKKKLQGMGFTITAEDNTKLEFNFKGNLVRFFPYSGWHTGKSIKDGRGFGNLMRQLTEKTK